MGGKDIQELFNEAYDPTTKALRLAGARIPDSQVAYTQTYSTADTTVAAATAVAVATTGATAVTPFGYTTAAQANAIVTAVNALIADVLQVRKVLNSVIDQLQASGISE